MLLKTFKLFGLSLLFLIGIIESVAGENPSTSPNLVVKAESTKKNKTEKKIKPVSVIVNRLKETSVDKLIKIQRLLRIYSILGRFSGVAMLIKDGEPIYRFASKYASLDYKIRCALSTRFNTCDITQVFTAAAIMQLVADGKIDTEDTIKKYLPKLPLQISENITIHQLLTHTSGLKDYYDLEEYRNDFYKIKEIDGLIDMIVRYPLDFTPGLKFKKSSSGYVLLAKIIEQISGISYEAYIQQHIFEPNDMKQSGLYNWFNPGEQQAVGYIFNQRGEAESQPEYWGAHAFGGDGLYCSIEDSWRFYNAFKNGKIVSSEIQDLMLSNQHNLQSDSSKYVGYGWNIKETEGQKVIYQGGFLGGVSTSLRHYPKDDYTILIYSNYGENIANVLSDNIEKILTTDYVTVPNHSLGLVLYELIESEGIESVRANFDEIVEEKEIVLKDIWPLYSLGQDYLREQKYHTALQIFELAIEKYDEKEYSDTDVLYDAMGDCHHSLGNKEQALEAFRTKLQLKPNDRRAIVMLKVIEETDYSSITSTKETTVEEENEADKPVLEEGTFTLEDKNTSRIKEDDSGGGTEDFNEQNTSDTPTSRPLSLIQTNFDPKRNLDESKEENKVTAETNTVVNQKIYTTAEVMPQFPGGEEAYQEYINRNLRYPTIAYLNGIEGIVEVDFIVDAYGNIKEVKTNSSIDESLALEALRVINKMPRWTSGTHEGKAVWIKLTIPIKFSKEQFIRIGDQ